MAIVYSIEKVKNLFTKVSLTDQYKLEIQVNDNVKKYINNSINSNGIATGPNDIYGRGDASLVGGLNEKVGLMCRATQIPGLSLDKTPLIGARQGITETFPSFRRYTPLDCTFYVDNDHDVIRFFNRWMQAISPIVKDSGQLTSTGTSPREEFGVSRGLGISNPANFYRMNYKDDYVCNLSLTKFEKNSIGKGNNRYRPYNAKDNEEVRDGLVYTFYRAYPLDIVSFPISYDSPNVLQITVSFEYERFSVS